MLLKTSNFLNVFIILLLLIYGCNVNPDKYRSCKEVYLDFENKLSKSYNNKDTLLIIGSMEKLGNDKCSEIDLLIADTYYDIGDYERSKICYRNVIEKDKGNTYATFNLSLIYYHNDEFDSAIYFLNKVAAVKEVKGFIVEFNSKLDSISKSKYEVSSLKISYYLGLNYYYTKNYKMAIFNFDYCIAHSYNLSELHLYRGSSYYESKEINKACSDFTLAKKLGNRNAETYLTRCNSK